MFKFECAVLNDCELGTQACLGWVLDCVLGRRTVECSWETNGTDYGFDTDPFFFLPLSNHVRLTVLKPVFSTLDISHRVNYSIVVPCFSVVLAHSSGMYRTAVRDHWGGGLSRRLAATVSFAFLSPSMRALPPGLVQAEYRLLLKPSSSLGL